MNKNLFLNPKVCKIQYVNSSDVVSYKIYKNTISVQFAQGKTWLDFYSTPGSASFEFPLDNLDGNDYFKQKVSMFFPGLDSSHIIASENASSLKYLIKISMNSGEDFIMGTGENPAQYIESFNSDKGGYDISFWCNSQNRPYLLIS